LEFEHKQIALRSQGLLLQCLDQYIPTANLDFVQYFYATWCDSVSACLSACLYVSLFVCVVLSCIVHINCLCD